MSTLRFRVEPRDIPAAIAGRLLGLTEAQFNDIKKRLFIRGFPIPDPDTGFYDRKAIEDWMDRRSGLTRTSQARDASTVVARRLGVWRNGGKIGAAE